MTENQKMMALIAALLLTLCCIAAGGILAFNLYFAGAKPKPPGLVFPTRLPGTASAPAPGATNVPVEPGAPNATAAPATSGPVSGPGGKIVFVCQLFRNQASDQLCVINADGSGWRRLTTDDKVRSFYPSFSPDGKSVVYSSNLDGNFKIYEISMTGEITPLGNTVGFAPEISPDNKYVVYANSNGQNQMIWIMDRDGKNPRLLHNDAWDPTWSPDSTRILFATTVKDKPQLAVINLDGSGFQQITDLPELRGRSDWSPDGANVVTYSGAAWQRELFMFNPDGSNPRQITPPGGNSQGPSFSPDGQWVAFTAYYNATGNNNGCEIYIMRINGENLKRLTENNYCDWQPRWGQ